MDDSRALRNRLRRIEGQVRGVQRLVDEDAPCVDVITQIAAVQTALEQVALYVIDAHVRARVAETVAHAEGPLAAEPVDELLTALRRFYARREEAAEPRDESLHDR